MLISIFMMVIKIILKKHSMTEIIYLVGRYIKILNLPDCIIHLLT